MLKKIFIMLLACAAVVPFSGGQLAAATQTSSIKTEDVAWWHGGWGGGWRGGYGYYGGYRGYYPYAGGYAYPYYRYNNPYYYYNTYYY